MTDTSPRVCLRHLWAACCEVWPDMPARHAKEGRSTVKDFDKRAAFCLAAKPHGFSNSQIGNYIRREHTSVHNAQKQAMERRSRDSEYGVAIIRIRQLAERLAADEAKVVVVIDDEPQPFHAVDPDAKSEEFASRFETMMEDGSRDLLRALVTKQAHVFAELRR